MAGGVLYGGTLKAPLLLKSKQRERAGDARVPEVRRARTPSGREASSPIRFRTLRCELNRKESKFECKRLGFVFLANGGHRQDVRRCGDRRCARHGGSARTH